MKTAITDKDFDTFTQQVKDAQKMSERIIMIAPVVINIVYYKRRYRVYCQLTGSKRGLISMRTFRNRDKAFVHIGELTGYCSSNTVDMHVYRLDKADIPEHWGYSDPRETTG